MRRWKISYAGIVFTCPIPSVQYIDSRNKHPTASRHAARRCWAPFRICLGSARSLNKLLRCPCEYFLGTCHSSIFHALHSASGPLPCNNVSPVSPGGPTYCLLKSPVRRTLSTTHHRPHLDSPPKSDPPAICAVAASSNSSAAASAHRPRQGRHDGSTLATHAAPAAPPLATEPIVAPCRAIVGGGPGAMADRVAAPVHHGKLPKMVCTEPSGPPHRLHRQRNTHPPTPPPPPTTARPASRWSSTTAS